ncbi:unnamed protein product [Jaminaea pallidilutea]
MASSRTKGRRSAVHAQEVDLIRSTSRAGSRAGSRVESRFGDASDDEGAGREEAEYTESFSAKAGPSYRRGKLGSSSLRSSVGPEHEAGLSSDAVGQEKSPARAAAGPSQQRPPLPSKFRQRDDSEDTVLYGNAQQGHLSDADRPTEISPPRGTLRRRYASDAQADEIGNVELPQRKLVGGLRTSVDASAAIKQLAGAAVSRPRTISSGQVGIPASLSGLSQHRQDVDTEDSLSISGSHSRPETHAGISSRLRASSRLSIHSRSRKGLNDGEDLFDASKSQPMPWTTAITSSIRPDLPSEAQERIRSLQARRQDLQRSVHKGALDADGVGALRSRVEDIELEGSGIASSSQSSSAISSAPQRRTHAASVSGHYLPSAPSSEPRKAGGLHKDPSDEHYSSMRLSQLPQSQSASSALRRYASQAAFNTDRGAPPTPDTSSRPSSRFTRGATPGPVLTSATPALSRTAAPHERNLLTSLEIFQRHFAHSGGAISSPNASVGSNARGDADEIVRRARTFVDTVTTLNAGLRDMARYVVQRQIEVDMGGAGTSSSPRSFAATLHELDGALASMMRFSDKEIRDLGDLLSALVRVDKERSRGVPEPGLRSPTLSARTDSRLSQTPGQVPWSPSRHSELRRSSTLSTGPLSSVGSHQYAPNSGGRSSASLRRDTRITPSSGNGSLLLNRGARQSTPRSGRERQSESRLSTTTGMDHPSQSPSMSVNAVNKGRYSSQAHGRSYSELAAGPVASSPSEERFTSRYGQSRPAITQREVSAATIRPSMNSGASDAGSTFSPRRPKLSDPSVGPAIAAASHAYAMSEGPVGIGSDDSADLDDWQSQSAVSNKAPHRRQSVSAISLRRAGARAAGQATSNDSGFTVSTSPTRTLRGSPSPSMASVSLRNHRSQPEGAGVTRREGTRAPFDRIPAETSEAIPPKLGPSRATAPEVDAHYESVPRSSTPLDRSSGGGPMRGATEPDSSSGL